MVKLPILRMDLPRRVMAIHQIELTSRCNLRCTYCPSPTLQRPKLDMTMAHFEAALRWVNLFVREGSQKELNLAGIGESTLHPDFIAMLKIARTVVGPDVRLVLATNGLIATEELARAFAETNTRVWVSLHRPEKAGLAVALYRRHGVLEGASSDPSVNGNDWAGQVDWISSGNRIPCQWIRDGKVMVMADGRVTACCLDASGCGVVGHIMDPIPPDLFKTHPYSLCGACYQEIGVHGYDQRKADKNANHPA